MDSASRSPPSAPRATASAAARFEREALILRDEKKVLRDRRRRDALEIETLAAAEDRRRHFLHVGRGEEKFHVRRRLLERLEQRVERSRREHVDLVHEVDFVARVCRHVVHAVEDEVAHLVHLRVRCGVEFDHVQRAPLGDFAAHFLLGIEVRLRPARAVQRLCKNARRRGLPGAARPDENVRVRDAFLLDGVAQRARDVLLAEDIGKGLGAIFACENRVAAHAAKSVRRDLREQMEKCVPCRVFQICDTANSQCGSCRGCLNGDNPPRIQWLRDKDHQSVGTLARRLL